MGASVQPSAGLDGDRGEGHWHTRQWGFAVGILFGGAIVSFTYWTAPEPLAATDLFSRGANEILFPVGCSLVLYSATALGERVGR
jgi:hypothetical protein